MKQVFVLHDAFAKPTDAWYQSIQNIIPTGYELITPELPANHLQGKKFWTEFMARYTPQWNEDTILITHGITSLLAINLLGKLIDPVRAYISIAGTSETPRHKVYEPIAESFLEPPIDWKTVQGKAKQVLHIWSKDDPFIEKEFSEFFTHRLPGSSFTASNAGHFSNETEPALFQTLSTLFNAFKQQDQKETENEQVAKEQQEREIRAQASIPSVVTYDTAVAQSVAGYQGKVISELLATAKADEEMKRELSPKNAKNIGYIIGAILFFIIGIGIIIYAIIPKILTVAPNYTNRQVINPIMRVEQESVITINTSKELYERIEELQEIQQAPVPERTFYGIIPIKDNTYATLRDFAEQIDLTLPLGLTGRIQNYLYGYYRPVESQSALPFIILEFSGYDVMHSILQDWEKDMIFDTLSILNPNKILEKNTLQTIPVEFINKTVSNIPTRIGTNEFGTTVSYGFINDQILVITPTPDIIGAITQRFIGK